VVHEVEEIGDEDAPPPPILITLPHISAHLQKRDPRVTFSSVHSRFVYRRLQGLVGSRVSESTAGRDRS